MVLIQLLLPTNTACGEPVAQATFEMTRAELADRFGGLTAYLRSPAVGLWTAPSGARAQDNVVMVEVMTDHFDREWWRGYAKRLAERFGQDVVHVRALSAEVLDPKAV